MRYLVPLLLTVALLLTACPAEVQPTDGETPAAEETVAGEDAVTGEDGEEEALTETPEAAEEETPAETEEETPAAEDTMGEATINIGADTAGNEVLTDVEGEPFYTYVGEQEPGDLGDFERIEAGDADTVGEGLDETQIGMLEQGEFSQLMYGDRPLYRFTGEGEPEMGPDAQFSPISPEADLTSEMGATDGEGMDGEDTPEAEEEGMEETPTPEEEEGMEETPTPEEEGNGNG